MPLSHLIIVCLAVLAALAILAWVGSRVAAARLAIARVEAAARIRTPSPRAVAAPSLVGHRVTVHTKQPDDRTIFGVVVGDYEDYLHLDDASYVTPDGQNPALPGRQDFRVEDIAWRDVHDRVARGDGNYDVRGTPLISSEADR